MSISLPISLIGIVLGLNSGICYCLLVSTLTVYFVDYGISLALVGLFSIRTLPYSFKYLWAPLVDHLNIKLFPSNFGLRKSWMLLAQAGVVILITLIAWINPLEHMLLISVISLLIALCAAVYDIAMEAYRISLATHYRDSQLNSYVVLGFRLGFLFAGAFCLYLSSLMSWQYIFQLIAIVILIIMLLVVAMPDTSKSSTSFSFKELKRWIHSAIIIPFSLLINMPHFYSIILAVGFYKVSDAYLDSMLIPFLLEGDYSKADIATFSKTFGLVFSIIGGFLGTYLLKHINMIKLLLTAEAMAASTNLLFIILTTSPKSNMLLASIMSIESFCSGISNITLISYLSSLCNFRRFTATHFAILSSVSGLFKALLASSSGVVVMQCGWTAFFVVSTLLSLPSILCLLFLYRNRMSNL